MRIHTGVGRGSCSAFHRNGVCRDVSARALHQAKPASAANVQQALHGSLTASGEPLMPQSKKGKGYGNAHHASGPKGGSSISLKAAAPLNIMIHGVDEHDAEVAKGKGLKPRKLSVRAVRKRQVSQPRPHA